MKRFVLAAFLAATLPAIAVAQQGPPAGGMGSSAPSAPMMMHHMSDADRANMLQMHQQARSAILKALSPASKALLSSIVAGLAVAENPDTKAAAAKLDAKLSASEKQAILNAANTMHAQMRAMMPSPPAGMSPPPGHMHMMGNTPADPGELLLMMSAMNIMGNDGMMHGGMMGGSPQ